MIDVGKMVERAFAMVVLPEEVGPERARRSGASFPLCEMEVGCLVSGIKGSIMEDAHNPFVQRKGKIGRIRNRNAKLTLGVS